jgi:hypothetical protein
MVRALLVAGVVGMACVVGGCGTHSYVTPGRGASMSMICGTEVDRQTDPSVRQELGKQPLASFPVTLAVVRVQEAGFSTRRQTGYGTGAYSVVTTQDVETPADFERLQKLPLVKGVAPLNRLVLPENLRNGEELRRAAASLGADMLLVYTFDTSSTKNDWAPPLAIITLGLFPTYTIDVSTTASMALLDVRNGFVYGAGQSSSKKSGISNAWTDDTSMDSMQRKAEREALDGVLKDLEKTWTQVALASASRPQREVIGQAYPQDVQTGTWVKVYPERVPEGKKYRSGP